MMNSMIFVPNLDYRSHFSISPVIFFKPFTFYNGKLFYKYRENNKRTNKVVVAIGYFKIILGIPKFAQNHHLNAKILYLLLNLKY